MLAELDEASSRNQFPRRVAHRLFFIQRYCLNKFGRHTTLPLTGCIASGSDKVKPHVLSAVYTFGLMC